MMEDIANDMNIVQLENYRQRLFSLRTAMQLAFDDEQSHQPFTLESSQRDGLSREVWSLNQSCKIDPKITLKQSLIAIDGALTRIDKDEFGICAICARPISEARLHFDPTATSCIDCGEKTAY